MRAYARTYVRTLWLVVRHGVSRPFSRSWYRPRFWKFAFVNAHTVAYASGAMMYRIGTEFYVCPWWCADFLRIAHRLPVGPQRAALVNAVHRVSKELR